ncbi:LysR family transcriptional regulator [Novosphingobium aquimarinum]|uniref:LysR family transcriptional regulator n=1 Tax=Novosphingobium aquimarinum TaxID=2682494 RepID=UPI0012EB9E1B|nr:LysR family transcriptional regulator [Novosphingobium aquimarinum]
MNWDDLRVFITAVRAGSYTAAGPRLNMNRTTVGRRINALEAALGLSLFRETPFGPEPTHAGQMLLAAAERMEAEVAAVSRQFGVVPVDTAPIRIAGSVGIAAEFMPEIVAFCANSSDITLELTGAIDPIEAVTYRRADLAVALVRAPPRRLAGVHVASVSQALYARRGGGSRQPLGWGSEVELALPRHWTAANLPDDQPASRFNSWTELRQAVRDGLGTAWLWCFAADPDEALERIAPPDTRYDTALWLLYRAGAPQTAQAALLTRSLADAMGRRIAGAQTG